MTKNTQKVYNTLKPLYAFKKTNEDAYYGVQCTRTHKAIITRNSVLAREFISSTEYRRNHCRIEKVIYDENKFVIYAPVKSRSFHWPSIAALLAVGFFSVVAVSGQNIIEKIISEIF